MAASYTYTCYLIDCSPSMARPLDPDNGHTRTRLDYALDFVRVKIAQRLINPKKTDQIAIVLFGGNTDNALIADGRDGYDHIEELIQMKQPSYEDLQRLSTIKIGEEDVDLVAAIYVAGNIVRNCKTLRKDSKKQVVLLTDAEEPLVKDEDGDSTVLTSWDDENWLQPLYEAIVPGLKGGPVDWKALFTLGVIGMDFGQPEVDEHFKDKWSQPQTINIQGIQALVDKINQLSESSGQSRALLGSILSATAGASAPSIAPIKTVTKHTKLVIGDEDEAPNETVSINVMVQKATQKAAAKSMQKMRKGAWKKSLTDPLKNGHGAGGKKKRRRGSDEDEEAEEEDDEDRSTLHDPGALVPEKQWYYVPDYSKDDKKKKPNANGEDGDNNEEDEDSEDEIEKAKRSEEARKLSTDENLSRAYKYGSDLIPISKEEETDFYAFPAGEPALMVRGFIKTTQFHPEWALGDPFWVFGGDDSRSQLAFSAFLWALKETKTIAVVRMLLPKISQPRVALLLPKVGDEAVDDRMEMGLMVPMPFKEEIANWSFPSLDRIQTVTGKPVTEHRLLPKKDLLHSMDDFVDSMMLPVYAVEGDAEEAPAKQEDEAGDKADADTVAWFDPNESYNPAIHNLRNCVIHKLLHPDEPITEDQEVHPALTRFLFPPDETMEASADPAVSLIKSAGLTLIPPKPKMARGRGRKKQARKPTKTALEELLGEAAGGEDDEEATQSTQPWLAKSQRLYRHHAAFSESQNQSQSQSKLQSPARGKSSPGEKKPKKDNTTAASPSKQKKSQKEDDDSSATEASDEEDGVTEDGNDSKAGHVKPSLLSYDDPIPDFEKLVKQAGMMTSQAMRQMCEIIPVFIADAKTEADMKKPRDCIVHARRAAIEEDESQLYNALLLTIKETLTKPGAKHAHFLQRLKKENLGLVTKEESASHHGDPDALEGAVTQEEADKFWK